jgi:SAM-dependent methyltransferase
MTAHVKAPLSRQEIVRRYCSGKEVLDVGCVQHDVANVSSDTWLHQAIVDVAKRVVGVDYLPEGVRDLQARGYEVIHADVNRPLAIDQTFDVIVVGNLIEHLSSFEGLLSNITRLLRPGGKALVSTANPFYTEQYFYSAFKNAIIVNKEHTCWIDPITLDQLARRFGLVTNDVLWVKERWRLRDVIADGDVRSLDLFTGRWSFPGKKSMVERLISPALGVAARALYPRSKLAQVQARYGGETARFLYVRFLGMLFGAFWSLRKLFIPTSDINRHELFVSVLTLDSPQPGSDPEHRVR